MNAIVVPVVRINGKEFPHTSTFLNALQREPFDLMKIQTIYARAEQEISEWVAMWNKNILGLEILSNFLADVIEHLYAMLGSGMYFSWHTQRLAYCQRFHNYIAPRFLEIETILYN